MKRYVVGFLFNKEKTHVALVSKIRPLWQLGKLNGIGGHIETGERPITAVVREFEEEAGLHIPEQNWTHTVHLTVTDRAEIFFFKAFGEPRDTKTMTDESILVYGIQACQDLCISNMKWIIPLSLDNDVQFPVRILDKSMGDKG